MTASRITRRQVEILELVADGFNNREIGDHLFLSEHTVKTHLRDLFRLTGAKDRAHAVRRGYELHLLADAKKTEELAAELGKTRLENDRYRRFITQLCSVSTDVHSSARQLAELLTGW